MGGFPQNPSDGTIFEYKPGLYYVYDLGTKQWNKATGGLFPEDATPQSSGLMSADDYAKLNRLIIPPPNSTIEVNDCSTVFDTGLISLYGDDFLTVTGQGDLVSGNVVQTVPLQLHQHTSFFDFKIDLEQLFKYLQTEGKVVVRAARGDIGKRGPQGDDGEDELQVGPTGPKGDQGVNAPQIGVLTNEPIPFKLKRNAQHAIVDLSTEEISNEENYLVVTRSRVGNPNACPTEVNIQTGTSSWVMAFPDDSQGTICRPIYYIDIDGLLEAIEDKFKSESDRVKAGYENVASYWLRVMSEVFDEQKAALCCALENCRSRGRNQDTRRYLEQSRIQAAAADYKIVIGGQESVDGEAYTYSKLISLTESRGTQPIPSGGKLPSTGGCTVPGWTVTINVGDGECDCSALVAGVDHCNRSYNSAAGFTSWTAVFSGGTDCSYEGIIELMDTGLLWLRIFNNSTSVVIYSLSGDFNELCASGGTLTRVSVGDAEGYCGEWPGTCTLTPNTGCDDDDDQSIPSNGYSTEPFIFPIEVPLTDKCAVKSIAANITWSSFHSLCSLQVVYGGAVIYDTGCAKPNRENFEVSSNGAYDTVYIRVLSGHCGDPAQESASWRFEANVQFNIGCDTDREVIEICESQSSADMLTFSMSFPDGGNLYSGETFTVVDESNNSLKITYNDPSSPIAAFSIASLPSKEYEQVIPFNADMDGNAIAEATASLINNAGLRVTASVDGSTLTIRNVQTVTQGASPTLVVTPDLPRTRLPTPIGQIPPLPSISDPTVGDHLDNPSDNPTLSAPPPTTIDTVQGQKQALHIGSYSEYGETTLAGNKWRQHKNYWIGPVGAQASGYRSTEYLIFSDVGLTIPEDAEILGIEVTVERLSQRTPRGTNDASDTMADVIDSKVQLVLNGQILEHDLAGAFTGGPLWHKWGGYSDFPPFHGSTAATTSFNMYGGSSYTWDREWIARELNGCSFGVAISAVDDGGSATKTGAALVKNVYIAVYYRQTVQANIDGFAPSQTRSVKPPVAVIGNDINWMKPSSVVADAEWVNFANILNNDRTSKTSIVLPAGGVSPRIGVSGWGTRNISDWQSIISTDVAKVGVGGVSNRVLTPISGIRRSGRVLGVVVTLEDVETSGGTFQITEARLTRYRPNPGSTQSIVESANKTTDEFTADPIVTGGCSTSIEFGGPTDYWGIELVGSDLLYEDKSKYTTFHFRVTQVGGSGDATFSFSGIKVQVFWEDEFSTFSANLGKPQVFNLDGLPIDEAKPELATVQQVKSKLILSDSRLVNADFDLESTIQLEISYSSDSANGTLLIGNHQGKKVAKFSDAVEPGLYYFAITNKSRSNGAIKLKSPHHSVSFIKGSGSGWDDSFISAPNEIFGLSGPPPGKSWWIHAKISEPQVFSPSSNEIVLEAKRNTGSVRQAARIQLPPGQYIAEIKNCTSRINGKYHAHVILSDGTKYYQFQNKGPQDTLTSLKRAYLGATVEINHKGGDLLAHISSPNATPGTGSVHIVFHDKLRYLANVSMRTNTDAIPTPIIPHCNMDISHLKWYEAQWQSKNCHGAVVNVAGQDYIVVLKLVDAKDPTSEDTHTPCIAAYKKFGHPAFAWPTFNHETFAGIPKSGQVQYSADSAINQQILVQIRSGLAAVVVGDPNLISYVLLPMVR